MKNTLIATAMVGIGSMGIGMTGSAHAQSTVTVYGVVDQYLDYSSTGRSRATRVQSGALDGSRLGFRGEEALGGGLKALFVLEAGIDADTGGSGQGGLAFGRQSFVGLDGNFGQLTFGRQYSAYYDTQVNYGLGGGLAWGNASNYFNEGSMLRINNAVKYATPSFNGLTFKALFGAGENSAPGMRSTGNVLSMSGQYDKGPFSINASYSTRQSRPDNLERWTGIGMSYQFGPIKPAILITDVRDDVGLNRNNMIELSAEIPMTNAALLVDVGHFRNRSFEGADATAYSLRYDYYLSKRTTVYTGVAYIKNDRNAQFAINGSTGAGLVGTPGDNGRALIAGVRHRF
jgi:predicted porin